MSYKRAVNVMLQEAGVELSTMMQTPCLRYKGNFIAMWFEKENSLIIKVSPERVTEIILNGNGSEFNFTKKRFKEWVLIPVGLEDDYELYIRESLAYARDHQK